MNIAIAAYKKVQSLERLIQNLYTCEGINNSSIYIFLDRQEPEINKKALLEIFYRYPKVVVYESEVHLGLRKNMQRIFEWAANETYPTVVLEDDLYTSNRMLSYAKKAIEFYSKCEKIGMVSLYHQHYIYTNEFPFVPLYDGNDVYFMRFASSSGFVVTPDMAKGFVAFQNNSSTTASIRLPEKINSWPESSWKKEFIYYLEASKLYTVFPRVSYTTNFGEKGEHHQEVQHYFQSPLSQEILVDPKFTDIDESNAIYDIYMEWEPNHNLLPEFINITFDLNGMKTPEDIDTNLVITSKTTDEYITSYGRFLKPQELNIVEKIPGDTFWLMNKVAYTHAKFPKKYLSQLIDYHYIFTSKSVLANYLKDFLF